MLGKRRRLTGLQANYWYFELVEMLRKYVGGEGELLGELTDLLGAGS